MKIIARLENVSGGFYKKMPKERDIVYEFEEFRLDVGNRRLLRNGATVRLTQKSFEILKTLIENRHRILKKQELLHTVWDDDFVEEATLTQHVYMLRKALRQNGKTYIETVPKNGYRFVAEVRETAVTFERQAENDLEVQQKPEKNTLASILRQNFNSDFIASTDDRSNIRSNRDDRRLTAGWTLVSALVALAVFSISSFLFFSNASESRTRSGSGRIETVAVMPFQVISGDFDEKLGLGMADVLITRLGKIEDLKVLPTSTIIRYSENEILNLSDAGRDLGADAVLTGTIQRDGNDVRITVKFYGVREENFLWAEKFDERFSDIFILQDAISERIIRELTVRRTEKEKDAPQNYTNDVEAHQAYSMGLFHWNSRTEDGLKKAIGQFRTAIEKDPDFALAHAYLADAYALAAYYEMSFLSREEARAKARQAAQRALEIEPRCSEAMTALATIGNGEKQYDEAYGLLLKAIEIKPNNAAAHQRLAWMLAARGELEKAIASMRTAQNLDPLSRITNLALAQLLNLVRRPEQASAYAKRVLEFDEEDQLGSIALSESFEQMGRLAEAARLLQKITERSPKNYKAKLGLSRVLAKKGRREQSRKILKSVLDEAREKDAYQVALVYIALNDRRTAFDWLARARTKNGISGFLLKNDPNLDALRSDPKFNEYVE